MQQPETVPSVAKATAADEDSDEEDDDLTDEQFERLEFIIDYLLQALNDEDNVVRWNAAKGIGRITMRLNADFAD